MKHHGIVQHLFPLHCRDELAALRSKWAVGNLLKLEQPIDTIRDYFDNSIGFYFAWLENYTKWLLAPAIFGILLWCFPGLFFKPNHGGVCISLIIFNTIWFALFCKFWRRKSSELSFRWGSFHQCDAGDKYLVEPRPLFKGRPIVNKVTGSPTLYWPSWRRKLIYYLVTTPVIAFCLLLMMLGSLLCLRLSSISQDYAKHWSEPMSSLISISPLILLVINLNFFNHHFNWIAIKLNDFENHFSQNDYVKNLQAKLILVKIN